MQAKYNFRQIYSFLLPVCKKIVLVQLIISPTVGGSDIAHIIFNRHADAETNDALSCLDFAFMLLIFVMIMRAWV